MTLPGGLPTSLAHRYSGARRAPGPRTSSLRTRSRRRSRPPRASPRARRRSLSTSGAAPSCAAVPVAACGSARTSSVAPSRSSRRTRPRAPSAADRRAIAGAAARRPVPRPGSGHRSSGSRSRPCARPCTRGARTRPNRRGSRRQTSRLRARPTIHSAISLPIPPAPARPWAQKPAATQKPLTPVGPRRYSPSGVNASGPFISWTTSVSEVGHAPDGVLEQRGEPVPVLRQQLPVEVRRDTVEGPRRGHTLVAADDQPSGLRRGSRRAGRVAHRREAERDAGGPRDQITWAIGAPGGRPRRAAISPAHSPPALTTTSVVDRPLVGLEPLDAGAALEADRDDPRIGVGSRRHRGCAHSAEGEVSRLGSMNPSVGR